MPKTAKTPRERAARALCEFHGHSPNIKMEGQPMWVSYLSEVDVVLQAALEPDAWEKICPDKTT